MSPNDLILADTVLKICVALSGVDAANIFSVLHNSLISSKLLPSDSSFITKEIVDEVRNASLDLADLKYEILRIVGDAYGNN